MINLPSLPKRPNHRSRRGLATGWLLIWSPVFLAMILLVIEVGNLMLARGQLENGLEAAALAAVQEWEDTGSTDNARAYAVSFARANTVASDPLVIDPNDPNDADGDVVWGRVLVPVPDDCSPYTFIRGEAPDPLNGVPGAYAIRTQKTLPITPVVSSMFGLSLGAYNVSAKAAAIHEQNGSPRLVRIAP